MHSKKGCHKAKAPFFLWEKMLFGHFYRIQTSYKTKWWQIQLTTGSGSVLKAPGARWATIVMLVARKR